jgi:hypothetical protein
MIVPPTPPATGGERSAARILVVAALIEIAMCASSARGQFSLLLTPGSAHRPQVIGATIAGIDCHGYYAWLRSPLIDGDWNFTNEYRFYKANWLDREFVVPEPATATGRAPNQWSVGPALVWSVGVVPVHLALTASGVRAEEPPGYSPPYQLAVGGVSLALALATLVFVYRIGCAFAPPVPAAAAAAVLVLGTTVGPYGTVMGGMAHGPASAALAGYVCLWVRTFGSARAGRWFAVGLLLGVACLMRWQLATFAVLPALECAGLALANRRALRPAALGVCAAFGALLGFVPQMIAWSVVYGQPIVNPHPTVAQWLAPAFGRVLFSFDRGLFYWTPVALLGATGLLMAARPGGGDPRCRFLLVAVAIQVYALAALVDHGICLGSSFGFRLLTETVVVLVVGLAVWFRSVAARRPTVLAVACGAAVAWNLLLLSVHCHSIPCPETTPADLISAVSRYIIRRPLEAVLWCVAATVLAVRLRGSFGSPESEPASRASLGRVLCFLVRHFGRAPAR